MTDIVAKILAVVTRSDERGQPLYVNAEIRHVIPLVILEAGMDVTTLSDKLRAIIDEKALAAGVKPGMSADDVVAALRAHYERYPPNPRLIADIAGALREGAASGGPGGTGAFAAVLGHEKVAPSVLGGGERPPGTVAGGIAAMLAARAPKKKK